MPSKLRRHRKAKQSSRQEYDEAGTLPALFSSPLIAFTVSAAATAQALEKPFRQ
jgi:hypothetical protein